MIIRLAWLNKTVKEGIRNDMKGDECVREYEVI
jgi:hypothetical protein